MGRKTERSRRSRKRRELARRIANPPNWVFMAMLFSSFVLSIEFLLAPMSFVRNGGETIAVDTATVTSCHRTVITGWAQYGCALEKDGEPYRPVYIHSPLLKTFRPVHGKVRFEVREDHGKSGTSYEIVKEGTWRPSFVLLILVALFYFVMGGVIFSLLRRAMKGCAALLYRSADRIAAENAEAGARAGEPRTSGRKPNPANSETAEPGALDGP
ncbi:hypothetical protein [Actinomadura violacea]|uniref:DUF3592 domain-containing protein n=1 Tax=Actinomadura violacea TaxID=2819934 RepID=A0ABS3SCB6_9ACTN|nr:hypothetical protein [Actinomadura violacea]MBO2465864.1 hypothetical protein [Actinomadura violacea]